MLISNKFRHIRLIFKTLSPRGLITPNSLPHYFHVTVTAVSAVNIDSSAENILYVWLPSVRSALYPQKCNLLCIHQGSFLHIFYCAYTKAPSYTFFL